MQALFYCHYVRNLVTNLHAPFAICSFLPDKHDLRGDKICIKIAPSSEYLKQQKKFAIQENSCCVNL